jgi:DNA-binding Lrp family transcriptional regulator
MDNTGRAIIEQLRRDGRLTNAELANRVSLTPAPCLRLVRRLEAEGVITGYHARVNPEALGQGFEVIVHIGLARRDRDTILSFEKQVVRFAEVLEVRRMFGTLDYVLRVATTDIDSYETFAIDRLQAIPGISKVESHITMKVLKQDLL